VKRGTALSILKMNPLYEEDDMLKLSLLNRCVVWMEMIAVSKKMRASLFVVGWILLIGCYQRFLQSDGKREEESSISRCYT
jgi:hypothetical protein